VVVTHSSTPTNQPQTAAASSTNSESSTSSAVSGKQANSGGLTAGGKTAIAVVIPIIVVALLIVAGILLWRRRNRQKYAEEERRKEMEAYGYNPNDDPTLPAVGTVGGSTLAEDQSGYRGWGPAGSSGPGRKTSTNASSGVPQYSDTGVAYQPGSPTQGAHNAEGQTGDGFTHNRQNTVDSDTIGTMGVGAAAGAGAGDAAAGLHRGTSNASSAYSNEERARGSGDNAYHNNQDYYTDNAYYQSGPYEAYNGGGQPIIRESPARRLTQVQEGDARPHEGGIARNF
jgi:hypothetical protein